MLYQIAGLASKGTGNFCFLPSKSQPPCCREPRGERPAEERPSRVPLAELPQECSPLSALSLHHMEQKSNSAGPDQPTASWEIINGCFCKPLCFGEVCYIATDNWNISVYIKHIKTGMGKIYSNSRIMTTSREGLREMVGAGKGGNIACNANLFYFKNKIWKNKAKC